MHAFLKERRREESGFTLIELLVVMIIIAILMAVAVPTFLSQKQNAIATKSKSNIKQIVNAIESCATSNTTGSYTEASNDCTSSARLSQIEPTLKALFTANGVEIYTVASVGGGSGFTVTGKALGSEGATVTWTETHGADGTITKSCAPSTNKACGGKATW
jgi:type IV pilus assembly protein PilA